MRLASGRDRERELSIAPRARKVGAAKKSVASGPILPEANESTDDKVACNLYHSSAVDGEIAQLLGAPHYSYRFAEGKFTSAFKTKGLISTKLTMPEYYGSADAIPASMRKAGAPFIHMIFRSTEQIRLLKFAWNVCCFAVTGNQAASYS